MNFNKTKNVLNNVNFYQYVFIFYGKQFRSQKPFKIIRGRLSFYCVSIQYTRFTIHVADSVMIYLLTIYIQQGREV